MLHWGNDNRPEMMTSIDYQALGSSIRKWQSWPNIKWLVKTNKIYFIINNAKTEAFVKPIPIPEYIYIYVYICMYIYIYIYVYIN